MRTPPRPEQSRLRTCSRWQERRRRNRLCIPTSAHGKDPSIQQWNFNIQRQVFSDILVELGYMGSKGIHEVYYSQGNQARLDPNPSSPTPILSRRLFPLWGSGMRTAGGDGVTSYEGGYVKLEKRFASGLSFLAHYSLGKALDYSSQVNETTRNFFDARMGKGRSLFDVRDRIVFSGTYELPVGPGKRFLGSKRVLGQVLGIGRSTLSSPCRAASPMASQSAATYATAVRPARRPRRWEIHRAASRKAG